MSETLFLSTVTNEFGAFRMRLARFLDRTKTIHVRHQDDFFHRGVKTLHALEEEIVKSHFVVHIIGAEPGWSPPVDQVEAFLDRHKSFVVRFPAVAAAARAGQLSATQWEAWLALFFGKRLYSYELPDRLLAGSPQKLHSERLHEAHEHPKPVKNEDALFDEILGSLIERGLLTKEQTERKLAPSRITKHSPKILFGRDHWLDALDAAWANPKLNVYTLVAWGGVGKTSLVAHWVSQRMAAKGWPGVERYFDWSFYSQGTGESRQTSSDLFIQEALKFFDDPDPTKGSPWERGERLAGLVRRHRTLLVLDGIEPLQYPVNDPQAGRLKDQALEALLQGSGRRQPRPVHRHHPRAPEEHREPGDDRRAEARQAGEGGGDCPVAPPPDRRHGSRDGGGLEGCRRPRADAAIARPIPRRRPRRRHPSLQGGEVRGGRPGASGPLGVQGDDRLRALAAIGRAGAAARAGRAAAHRPLRPADVARLPASPARRAGDRRPDGRAGEAERPAVEHRPEAAERSRSPDRDAGGHRRPSADPRILRQAASRHAARRVPGRSLAAVRSPVRERRRIAPIRSMACNRSTRPSSTAASPGDSRRRASKVYLDRILRGTGSDGFYSTNKLGAIGADLAAVAAFFDEPWSRVSPNLSEADQAWLLNEAAFSLRALGRLTEALQPMRAGLEMRVQQKNWKNAAISASNLSELEVTLGRLTDAVADARQSITHADQSGDAFRANGQSHHGGGRLAPVRPARRSRLALRRSRTDAEERQPQFDLLYSLRGFRYCDWLLAPAERAAWQALLRGTSFQPVTDDALAKMAMLRFATEVERRATTTLEWATETNWLSPRHRPRSPDAGPGRADSGNPDAPAAAADARPAARRRRRQRPPRRGHDWTTFPKACSPPRCITSSAAMPPRPARPSTRPRRSPSAARCRSTSPTSTSTAPASSATAPSSPEPATSSKNTATAAAKTSWKTPKPPPATGHK